MKNFRKVLLLTALLSISFTVSAQQRPAPNQDSTNVGIGGAFTNNISSGPSNANNAVVAPIYCQNRTMTWTVNGNTCSGTATQTNEGANRTVTSIVSNTGSATYTCQGNNFINPRSLTCVAPTPPPTANGCPAGQSPSVDPNGAGSCQIGGGGGVCPNGRTFVRYHPSFPEGRCQ